jgi:hypothetical protein
MELNSVLTKYDIKIVNSKRNYKCVDIKSSIANWELIAKREGKDGLILLAGGQLTLGVTLPLVDIVLLFNDTVASDRITQMMYRCMTESIPTEINNGVKKNGICGRLKCITCIKYLFKSM